MEGSPSKPEARGTEPETRSSSTSAAAPLKASLKANKVFLVDGHYGTTQLIKIFDVTRDVGDLADLESAESFKKAYEVATKTKDLEPYLQVRRHNWYGHSFTAEWPGSQEKVAEWKGGWTSANKNAISFPSDSTISSHNITMGVDSYYKFREKFVFESVSYLWSNEKVLALRNFKLTQLVAGQETEIAKVWCSGDKPGFRSRRLTSCHDGSSGSQH
jgi:hypothetical protein